VKGSGSGLGLRFKFSMFLPSAVHFTAYSPCISAMFQAANKLSKIKVS